MQVTQVAIKTQEQSGECNLVLKEEGFVAITPKDSDKRTRQIDRVIFIPWSKIESIERSGGTISWRLKINLRSHEDPCVITFLYELHPASIYGEIVSNFGDKVLFVSTPTPRWKPLVVPFGLAAFAFIGGWWLYHIADQHVKAGGHIPVIGLLLYYGFGPIGILAFCWIAALLMIGLGFRYLRLSQEDGSKTTASTSADFRE